LRNTLPEVTRPRVGLTIARRVTVTVPVNADFEGGFAVDPQQVNANVKLAVATGIAGETAQ
jgi:2-methylisocitrate lyase-like PEP mutase family enzyme